MKKLYITTGTGIEPGTGKIENKSVIVILSTGTTRAENYIISMMSGETPLFW